MAIKWKVGELLKSLIEEERPSVQPETQAPEETVPAPAVIENQPEAEQAEPQYIDMQGALLELWRKFNGDGLAPGRMQMLDEERLNTMHLTKQKFELERLRLATQM